MYIYDPFDPYMSTRTLGVVSNFATLGVTELALRKFQMSETSRRERIFYICSIYFLDLKHQNHILGIIEMPGIPWLLLFHILYLGSNLLNIHEINFKYPTLMANELNDLDPPEKRPSDCMLKSSTNLRDF